MSAAHTLYRAGNLLARFGHEPGAADGGCPLTGYTIPGAVRQAAVDLAAEAGEPHPRLSAWVSADAAMDYLLAVLGHDPDEHGPAHARQIVRVDGKQAGRFGLGPAWAVAVVDQAAALALASSIRTPTAALEEATRPVAALTPAAA